MSIRIREHRPGTDLESFLRVPELLYAGDPGFVAPLRLMAKDQLTPKKNPLFEHSEVALFTAYQNDQLAGRISAQVDRQHLDRYRDACGLFGFFDTTNDVKVGKALVDAAASWLKQRGMRIMRGPFSLSINEESGTMVAGHAEPSIFGTPYHRAYQHDVALAAGLTPCKDMLSWRYSVGHVPERAKRAHAEVLAMPEVKIRSVRMSHLQEDVQAVMEVFNDAWADNFHFVPMTSAELAKLAQDLKFVLDERIALIAEVHGKPAAIALALPNLNEAMFDLNGRLFPLGLPKLLYRLKLKHPRSAVLRLLGVKREFRSKKRYGGLSTALYV
ncbi:MAG TPA: hypothetical protein VFZ61_20215, partial [Polyangiales bacterium]